MPQVRVVKISFDTSLKPFEIPAFRGAVIQLVGRDRVSFHNHLDDTRYHYAYPVVQYKSEGGRAGIVCVQEGVDDIHHFFVRNEGGIRIGSKERPLYVESVRINRFGVRVTEEALAYQLHQWLPLNEKNYALYRQLEGVADRLAMLERMLVGNILSFAKGVGWTVDRPIQVKITDFPREQWVKHKGIRLLAFEVAFTANVLLPTDIGLGKGASVGFGTLTSNKHTKQ